MRGVRSPLAAIAATQGEEFRVGWDGAVALAEATHAAGRTVAVANGCFDLLHVGHLSTLEFAAEQADVLIVLVDGDHAVRLLKGPSRPIVAEWQRLTLVAALRCVDWTGLFSGEEQFLEILRSLRPDVLVKGQGTRAPATGVEILHHWGGRLALAPRATAISTTELIERAICSPTLTLRDVPATGSPYEAKADLAARVADLERRLDLEVQYRRELQERG